MSTPGRYVAVAERALARQALEAYALRHQVDDDTIPGELPALVDQAKAAGLDTNTIAAFACGREAGR
jgi:hypothetical protein